MDLLEKLDHLRALVSAGMTPGSIASLEAHALIREIEREVARYESK